METTPNTPITITMSIPKLQHPWTEEQWNAHYNHIDVAAHREFRDNNSEYTKVPSRFYTELDMTQAHVGLTRDHIKRNSAITTTSEDGTTQIITYTMHRQWAVFAPRISDGVLFVVAAQSKYLFDTEAQAIKFMKQTATKAKKWQAAEALRNQYAEQARIACRLSHDLATRASDINPADAIGALTFVRAMGKTRIAVIVGQTATKYEVVFTTPSNTDVIRTAKINKR